MVSGGKSAAELYAVCTYGGKRGRHGQKGRGYADPVIKAAAVDSLIEGQQVVVQNLATLPEPATMVLLALGGGAVLRKRRRREMCGC